MESLFFNITDRRYKVMPLYQRQKSQVVRVDVSNGLLFFHGTLHDDTYTLKLENLDRMVLIVMVHHGRVMLTDAYSHATSTIREGERGIFVSSKQKLHIVSSPCPKSSFYIFAVADFFLKRYLSGQKREPIDMLYAKMQGDVSLERVALLPVDALSLYLVERLLVVQKREQMQSIRAEHRVIEFLIHTLGQIEREPLRQDAEELHLATAARQILLAEFANPPTIAMLAHRCATNATKLKRVFKRRYGVTIYQYIQKLRLQEANVLLRHEDLSIGEIARRVGYRHQGHFTKLFYDVYGIYPRALQHH